MVTIKTICKSFDHNPRCPSVLWLPECKARVDAYATYLQAQECIEVYHEHQSRE